jgi:hypothetical protein
MSGAQSANAARGEARLGDFVLRPSFAALVAAEAEVGPLFALVERAGDGRLTLAESIALLWHCACDVPAETNRADFAETVTAGGMAALAPALRTILTQIVRGC